MNEECENFGEEGVEIYKSTDKHHSLALLVNNFLKLFTSSGLRRRTV